jgi:hypothetical protein
VDDSCPVINSHEQLQWKSFFLSVKVQVCPNSSAEEIHLSSRYYQAFIFTVFMRNCYSRLKLQLVNCRSRHELLFECLEHVTFDVKIWPGAQFKKGHCAEVRLSLRTYQSVSAIQSVCPSNPKFSHSPIRISVTGELPRQKHTKSAWIPEESWQCKSKYKFFVQNETFSKQRCGLQ